MMRALPLVLTLQALVADPAEAQQRAGRGAAPIPSPPPGAATGAIDVPTTWLAGLFAGAAAAMASPLFVRVVGVGTPDHLHPPLSSSNSHPWTPRHLAGEAGVQHRFGQVDPAWVEPGLHFRMPWTRVSTLSTKSNTINYMQLETLTSG